MEVEEIREDSVGLLDMDEPITVKESVGFLDKNRCVGKPVKFVISDVRKAEKENGEKEKSGYAVILEDSNGSKYRYVMSKKNLTFLLKNYGETPAQWLDKSVYLTGTMGVWNIGGRQQEGVTIDFS